MTKELEHTYFKTGSALSNWLTTEHNKSSGIWIVFYKKHTNIECIDYQDALDEKLKNLEQLKKQRAMDMPRGFERT